MRSFRLWPERNNSGSAQTTRTPWPPQPVEAAAPHQLEVDRLDHCRRYRRGEQFAQSANDGRDQRLLGWGWIRPAGPATSIAGWSRGSSPRARLVAEARRRRVRHRAALAP